MKKVAIILIIILITFVGINVGMYVAGHSNSNNKEKQVLVAHSNKEVATPVVSTISQQIVSKPALPKTIRIPKINVDGNVEQVGLDSKRAMAVPEDSDNAGWYKLGPRPGEVGNAVLAGHLDKESGAPAIFYGLTDLTKGDPIYIVDESGKEYEFAVIRMQKYPYNAFPIGEVFGKTDKTMLNLITCQGNWDSSNKNYSHRYVIYSELVSH